MTTRTKFAFLLLLLCDTNGEEVDPDREQFCKEVEQCKTNNTEVCGIRLESDVYHLKIFPNECELLKYGCEVEEKDAYGIINMHYCTSTSSTITNETATAIICNKHCPMQSHNETVCGIRRKEEGFKVRLFVNKCEMMNYNCKKNFTFNITDHFICDGLELAEDSRSTATKAANVDATQAPEETYSLTELEGNEATATEHSASTTIKAADVDATQATEVTKSLTGLEGNEATTTDNSTSTTTKAADFDATQATEATESLTGLEGDEATAAAQVTEEIKSLTGAEGIAATATEHSTTSQPFAKDKRPIRKKNVIIVDANMFSNGGSINDSIDNFFSATHVFDMPLKDVSPSLDENTRRMFVRVFGPVVVYRPSVNIPKNISTDLWHSPTLASCYHTCPVECPDTYAPVCGMPGQTFAREPSLMFRNHCFMDAAQCHMRWTNQSYTAVSSSYTESSFYFCVGDTLNGLYRFLPLIRTLQHMGRLKRKGRFRTRLRNMRYFNELLQMSPRLMG